MKITYLVDVSGRVARDTAGAEFVSAGGVCLPTGALRSIRKRLPVGFPKWRDASDDHVQFAIDVILSEAFSAGAVVLDKSTEHWPRFWAVAEEVHSRTASLSGGSITFVKAATQIRYLLFASAAVLIGAHAVRANRFPYTGRRKSAILKIEEQHIYDSELDHPDNVGAFREVWAARNRKQPLTGSFGLEMRATSVAFDTEQSEPLLLLADYVAGIVQSSHSTANVLRHSRVTREAAQSAHRKLRCWAKFAESTEIFALDYFEIFPAFRQFVGNAA